MDECKVIIQNSVSTFNISIQFIESKFKFWFRIENYVENVIHIMNIKCMLLSSLSIYHNSFTQIYLYKSNERNIIYMLFTQSLMFAVVKLNGLKFIEFHLN